MHRSKDAQVLLLCLEIPKAGEEVEDGIGIRGREGTPHIVHLEVQRRALEALIMRDALLRKIQPQNLISHFAEED